MKREHLEIIWDSCSELEKSTISFAEFLEKVGRALESANMNEARYLGKLVCNLEIALYSGDEGDLEKILLSSKRKISQKIKEYD